MNFPLEQMEKLERYILRGEDLTLVYNVLERDGKYLCLTTDYIHAGTDAEDLTVMKLELMKRLRCVDDEMPFFDTLEEAIANRR